MRAHPVGLGEMTEELGFYSRTLTADGSGGATAAWTLYATVWAHVRPLTGGERLAAMRTEAKGMFLIVMRNRDDVKEADSISWGELELNIRFIRARGPRDLYMELEAELGARK